MPIIPIDAIRVSPDRQRKHLEPADLVELSNSIAGPAGLLHAIVVAPEDNGTFLLVAGERRLRAIKMLFDLGGSYTYQGVEVRQGKIPAAVLSPSLANDELEEAELHENIKRVDLTWQEKVAAVERLHKLRSRQAAARGDHQTVAKTGAEVVGVAGPTATNTARVSLTLAEHLKDKDVAGAATVKEALKIIERKAKAKENALLAAAVGEIKSPHELIIGSCLEVPIEMVGYSVILTDPPYGMGADQFDDGGGAVVAEHNYQDDEATFEQVTLGGLARIQAYTLEQAHAYVFCDFDKFHRIKAAFRGWGWEVFRTPLIWAKDGGRVPLPEHGPRRTHEYILYARRGGKRVNYIGSDVLTFPSDTNLGMSAQKPVALFAELLARSTRPGDWVIDPFCGTGPIFPAASKHSCRAVGIELNPATAGISARRLKGE